MVEESWRRRRPRLWATYRRLVSAVDLGESSLIERECELAAIAQALDGARTGNGALVAVEGAPGVGKTLLIDSAAALGAADGQRIQRASGAELEVDLAWGVVYQLFEPLVRSLSADRLESLRGGAAGLALELFDVSRVALRAEPTSGLLHGVCWLTIEMAVEAPLVLIVDDAHWADAVSLRALAYLARRLDGVPVTIAVTVRPGAVPPGSPLSALLDTPGLTKIVPRALSPEGTRTLVGRLTGKPVHDEVGTACHSVTGGNPFLICELVRAIRSDGGVVTAEAVGRIATLAPGPLARLLTSRLRSLSDDAVKVGEAVAVFGDRAAPLHVAKLAGLTMSEASVAADALVRAGVITDTESLSFTHPLVRSAVYGALSAAVRGELHRRAARLLGDHGAPTERVAGQLLVSVPAGDRWAVDVLVAASARASEGGAFDAAARFLARALAEPPAPLRRGEILLALGRAELASGDRERAIEHLRAALDTPLDPDRRVVAALALVQGAGANNAIELLDEVAVGLAGEPALRLDVVRTSIARYLPDHAAGAMEHMRSYSQLQGDTASERLALAALAFAHTSEPSASAKATFRIAQLALDDDRLIGEQTGEATTYTQLCYALLSSEEFAAVDRQIELQLADAQRRGSRFAFFVASITASCSALLRGDILGAAAHGQVGLQMVKDLPATMHSSAGASFIAMTSACALVERGKPDEATQVLSSVPISHPTFVTRSHLDLARGYVALAEHNHNDALEAFLGASAAATNASSESRLVRWRLGAALALSASGRADEAIECAEAQLELDNSWGAPGGLGEAQRVRAIVGDPAEAHHRLCAAEATLRKSMRRLQLAHALVDLGSTLRRAGQRIEARAPLAEGLDLAATYGARPLVERARAELVITGARPRRDRHTGRDALTPSEDRIAALAAQGQTNRWIAETLFLTPKTVEQRLTVIYRKLGIAGRARLADALAAPAPPPPAGDQNIGGVPR